MFSVHPLPSVEFSLGFVANGTPNVRPSYFFACFVEYRRNVRVHCTAPALSAAQVDWRHRRL
jgi:hypothetical protein